MGANESRGGSGSGNNDEDGDDSRRKRNTGAIVAAGAGAVAGALLAYGLSRKPPPASTMKLNVDGSRKDPSGAIAAGGLIRNSAGDWIAGFSANLGYGDILKAELSALCHGLELALRMEVNPAADALAKMGHGMEMGTHFFDKQPDGISGVLEDDRAGRTRPRWI
ncbi:PREDICTED: ribonuclease [Prunus dulcis]|uniref:PREDICTED: ribonuclease n=1 Tax=Prunus dulcis TaxID=3755 RepID=A0A5E4F160_PRUDU|nr:PREDICTED: ribonuclease [Prunus dulcis]